MMRSLQRHLLQWVLGALSVGGILLLAVSYFVAIDELGKIFDEHLKQVAVATANHHNFDHPQTAPKIPVLHSLHDRPRDFVFVTAVWSPQGELLYSSHPNAELPFIPKDGKNRVKYRGESWHVYTFVLEKGIVQAAQRSATRKAAAREVASKSILPTFLLVLIIGVLIVFALRRGLKPLDRAAADVAKRSGSSLEPIQDDGLPAEILPLVHSLNALLARLGEAFFLERKFVADAAHGLRTPITALRLQSQLIQKAENEDVRGAALEDLRLGIARSQHLIEQLLALSRLDPEAGEAKPESVSIGKLVRASVGQLSIRAEQKNIDLGAQVETDALIKGNEHQLMALLDNLVDNAIRYTQPGGVIDVKAVVDKGHPAIIVQDDGPGIAEAERDRVFDRFYRGGNVQLDPDNSTGSGLGLSIVKAIVERHHATITLSRGANGKGLRVTVRFEAT